MKKVISLFTLFALAFVGCKEEDGPNMSTFSESPRFYINANVNGLPLNLVAGELGYQMYTNFSMEDSVLIMTGVLATDSPAYKNALVLKMRGSELMDGSTPPHPGDLFRTGPLALADLSGVTVVPDHFDYHFFTDTVNGHIPLRWITPSNSYYGDSCSIVGLSSRISPSFNIEMSSTGPLTCTPTIKHTIQTGADCKAQVHVLNSTSSELQVEAQARIGRISKVKWKIADQEVGQGDYLSYSVVGFQTGYRVRAEIQFESGCTEIIEKVIFPGGSNCDVNIDYRKEPHRKSNPHNLATVEIQYYDETGKLFSSAYPGTNGNFIVESINSYNDLNSRLKHQRFSFSGEAILKSADGSSLQLNNVFGSFALAHP